MFIPSYLFKAHIKKVELLRFVATVSPTLYCFLIPKSTDNFVYGYLISDEVVEYFLNEYLVKDFAILGIEELKEVVEKCEYEVWDNRELW